MKFKNFISFFCIAACVFCAVACSDDDDEKADDSVPTVTEPLSTPENITYTATLRTLNFSWNSVSNATSYEVSLAPASAQDDKSVSATNSASFSFSGLEVNTSYVFEVKALYGPNSDFDSDYAGITASTNDYSKLNPPTNLRCTSVTQTGATIAWNTVTDADSYKIVIEDADGGEVVNAKQTANTYTVSNLEEDAEYTVYVYALLDYGNGEYDSDAATLTFTTGLTPLTSPSLTLVYKSYGIAIMEWEYTNAMLSEQGWCENPSVPQGDYSDRINFRLCDSNGNVLREVDNFDNFFYRDYPYYRYVWGGLEPNTTYRMEMQRVVTGNTAVYGPSAWSSVEVTTDSAPDKSDYLLYWDFENVASGPNAMFIAYGPAHVDYEDCWSDPDNLTYLNGYLDNSIDCQPIVKALGQSFLDEYMPGLSMDNYIEASGSASFSANTSHNLGVQAGHMRFAPSSAGSWLTIPIPEDIEEDSTILLEISACPYGACSTGNVWGSWNGDECISFTVEVSDEAKIVSATADHGKSDSTFGTIATLNNVSVKYDMATNHGDGDPFYFTNHQLVISGVGPDTRIVVYTSTSSTRERMWADDIKISLVEDE